MMQKRRLGRTNLKVAYNRDAFPNRENVNNVKKAFSVNGAAAGI